MNEGGFLGIYKYWKPFELLSVKRILDSSLKKDFDKVL